MKFGGVFLIGALYPLWLGIVWVLLKLAERTTRPEGGALVLATGIVTACFTLIAGVILSGIMLNVAVQLVG